MQRIVTGHDADGRPEIQIDGPPVTVMDFGSIETTEIWVTDGTPAGTVPFFDRYGRNDEQLEFQNALIAGADKIARAA